MTSTQPTDRFGAFGGRYVPETLIPALDELEAAYALAQSDAGFRNELSTLLSTYVRKYFHDMFRHFEALGRVLRPGGSAFFVVGNSKFYDVVVPVEQVLARQFEQAGFRAVAIETLRKRSSKKELYEYLVRATKPG